MAAKLLHALADDNPDLQKQIGCMTEIFQLFDRQQALTGRGLIHARLPPGDYHFSHDAADVEPVNAYLRHIPADLNLNRFEKQRICTESSTASFSSSCSSSLSSVECSRAATQEASSFDRITFPENHSRDIVMLHQSTSPHLGRKSLDLRDVVKDSMYRELKELSRKKEAMHSGEHKHSPRPFPNSLGGTNGVGNNGKQKVSDDLKESLRVLAKLQQAPRYSRETRERPRSSYESKDGSSDAMSKDAPRFSCDGREINRLSFESRDTVKSTLKLKELPRLSLDSREISMRSNPSSQLYYPSSDFPNSGSSNDESYDPKQSPGAQKRPPSVVAKLMGLEGLPESASTSHSGCNKISPGELSQSSLRLLKTNDLSMQVRIPKSPRTSMKEPISPRWKNPDLIMKPMSKVPIEPAPWKQLDSSLSSHKPAFKSPKIPKRAPNSFPTVYSEFEKRLKDLEFKQSGKDLRALKQIMEAMQAKGLLQTGKKEQDSKFQNQRDTESKHTDPNQKAGLSGPKNQQSNTVRTFESPIVIMKPAKLIQKSDISPSVIHIDGLSGIHKVPTGGYADNRKGSVSSRSTRDQAIRNSHKDSSINSSEKKASLRNVKQSSTRPSQLLKDSTANSVKTSGSVSPRLQQKKLEMEKRSRPPTPPCDSNKPRKLSSRQLAESGSPGRKHRIRSPKVPQSDDQLSQISNESRTSSQQGDDVSVQSENTVIFDSKMDTTITSIEQSTAICDVQSPFLKAPSCTVSDSMQRPISMPEDGMEAELDVVALEHRSPVSVLDVSVYRDDALSPVKHMPPDMPIVDFSARDFRDEQGQDTWKPSDKFSSDSSIGSGLNSVIDRKKLQSIENLVQKLRRVNSTHDEASTDYIASLCENTNPDHRYISEILLASGLLLKDIGSDLTTFQLHTSGYPINPELFFVLEQTKSSSLVWKEEYRPGKTTNSKRSLEKSHRQLIFDAVNEILLKKLALVGCTLDPWLKSDKLTKKTTSAQKLLKELCSEIEQLQLKKSEISVAEGEDGLKGILMDDVVHRWESWTDCGSQIPDLVLDVERLIFKDLVGEIVRAKHARRGELIAR